MSRLKRNFVILLTLLLPAVNGLAAKEPDKDDNGFLWTFIGGVFTSARVKGEIWDVLFGGFGPRFAMIPDRRINARLDFVWGIESFAAYFALGGPSDNA